MPYTARTNQVANLAVNVLKDGGAEDNTEPWTITADAPFASDFTPEAGTGDSGSLTGPFYNGRSYTCTFTAIAGFDTPAPVTFTASGTLQTFTGDYITSSGATTEDITVVMGAAGGESWTLRDTLGIVATGSAGETAAYLPGTYILTWEDTAYGFTPPAPSAPTVLALGSPFSFPAPVYAGRTDQLANFSVDVQRDGGAQVGSEFWIMRATTPYTNLNQQQFGLGDAPGNTTLLGPFYEGHDYLCNFAFLGGFESPDNVTLTAGAGAQVFTGNYKTPGAGEGVFGVLPRYSGTIVNTAQGSWTFTGPAGSGHEGGTTGSGDKWFFNLIDGLYTAVFDDNVPGFSQPADSSSTLDSTVEPDTFSQLSNYVLTHVEVNVAATPHIGNDWQLSGPDPSTTPFYAGSESERVWPLVPGTYSIDYQDVPAWTTPDTDSTGVLAAGDSATFTPAWVAPTPGTITVAPTGVSNYTFRLVGPYGYALDGDQTTGAITGLAAGRYTVEWGFVTNFLRPVEVTLNLDASASETIVGVYSARATIAYPNHKIGMNIASPVFWQHSFWADVARSRDTLGAGGTTTDISEDGWPTSMAASSLSVTLDVFDPGVYTVDWVGNGTFTVAVVAASASEVFVASGPGSGTIDLSSLPGRSTMTLTFSAVGSPHCQPRVYHSKYNATIDTQAINAERVAEFQQTGAFRPMDWQDMNTTSGIDNALNASTGWTAPSWAYLLQWQVEIANQLGRDMWVNVPHEMNDAGIAIMVDVIETTYLGPALGGSLKWHVEYSNEVWNGIFLANGYARDEADIAIGLGDTRYYGMTVGSLTWERTHRFQVVRCKEIHDIIAAHASAPTWNTRCIRTLGSQVGSVDLVNWMLGSRIDVGAGEDTYDKHFDAYAIAPYLNLFNLADEVALGDFDATFALVNDSVTRNGVFISDVTTAVGGYESGTSVSPMPVIAYEWGQHVYSDNSAPEWVTFIRDIQHDPRMYTAYVNLLAAWDTNGGSYPMCHWTSPVPTNPFGGWGVKETWDQPDEESQKWAAILDWQHDNA